LSALEVEDGTALGPSHLLSLDKSLTQNLVDGWNILLPAITSNHPSVRDRWSSRTRFPAKRAVNEFWSIFF
jgi:hypothetical protein